MAKEFDPEPMNQAAVEAESDLSQMLIDNPKLEAGVDATAEWVRKWYNRTPNGKPGAGYKRLGRLLVGIAKENAEAKPKSKKDK